MGFDDDGSGGEVVVGREVVVRRKV